MSFELSQRIAILHKESLSTKSTFILHMKNLSPILEHGISMFVYIIFIVVIMLKLIFKVAHKLYDF